jgi:hypothetical protein
MTETLDLQFGSLITFHLGLADNAQCHKSGLITLTVRFNNIDKPTNLKMTMRRNRLLHQFTVPVLIRKVLFDFASFIYWRICITPQVLCSTNRHQPVT